MRGQIIAGGALALAVLFAAVAEGQSSLLSEQLEGHGNGFRLVATAELEKISPSEVAGGGAIPPSIGGLPLIAMRRVEEARVSRQLKELWELWVPEGTRPTDLRVSLELVSASSDCDCLSNRRDSRSLVGVTIRPTLPVVVDRREGQILMQGGALLELDLDSVVSAGVHGATLAQECPQVVILLRQAER